MDPGCSDGNNHQTPILRKRPLVAMPVSAGSSGDGLPYAPEDWPHPGDVWHWRVGRRVSAGGYWIDRSLRPPRRLLKDKVLSKHMFYSRVLVEQYVRKEFPEVDVKAFFDSFIWKIPSKDHAARRKGSNENVLTSVLSQRFYQPKTSESQSKISLESGGCKAGNKMCGSQTKAGSNPSLALECDICCSEAGFCHDCCCILCCKAIDWVYDGYSFIRCEQITDKNFVCGHVAHMDCALRAYMAGTIGGSIGLDVEYCCRCCDSKTDLIPHVSRILHTCKSLDSRDDIEKILNLALRILHGSEKMKAKILWKHIQSVIAKFDVGQLRSGVCLGDIWEDSVPILTAETGSASTNGVTLLGALDVTDYEGQRDILPELESSVGEEIIDGRTMDQFYINSDHEIVATKLEDEVDQALQELRKSQESEYKLAEQKLYSRKDYVISLYQQLAVGRTELTWQTSSQNGGESNFLPANALNIIDQIKQEESKLREMMLISKGFGQASKQVKDYFQLVDD